MSDNVADLVLEQFRSVRARLDRIDEAQRQTNDLLGEHAARFRRVETNVARLYTGISDLQRAYAELNERFDGVDERMSKRFDRLDGRLDRIEQRLGMTETP